MITVQRLSTPALIEEAGALLYQSYIEQQKWKFNLDNPSKLCIKTCNNRKILVDRFTEYAIWFGAFDNEKLVGCIRLCSVDENNRLEIESYVSSQPIRGYIPEKRKNTVFEITKMATKQDYVGRGIVKRLFLACFKYCEENNYSVIACTHNGYLKALFKKIGFPMKREHAFKYEEHDSYPVTFYFADYKKLEVNKIMKKLEYLENDLSNNAAKIFKALETVEPLLPTPFYWMDVNGVVLGINELCLKAIGTSREIIGKKPYEFYKKEIADHILKHNAEVIRKGEILSQEEWIEDITTKEVKCFSSVKAPLYDDEGRVIGIIGSSVEMTAEKEAERLRLENTVIEQKAKIAAMLAAGIAHELRTPLANINILAGEADDIMHILVKTYQKAAAQGFAEGVLQPRQLENALTIGHELRRTAHSANIFINMMLMKVNLEKPKSGKLTRLSASNTISEALSLYPLRGSDITLLEWNPAQNEDFYFMGDATLFNHILFNLFRNALHHIKAAQKGKIEIWLETGKKHNFLHFKDTGPGIPTEILPHIFDVFYSKTAHGTGVGLALCKMIMTEFGGKISCNSVIGEYTHFILEFLKLK